jgi:predicted O-methyltransferase YrrM
VCVFEHELERIGNENQPIDFLFLDGNHHEEPTMLYFGLALPFLEPGAIVVFDDIGWNDGMRRAWRRIQEHPSVRTAVKVGSIGVTRIVR